MGILASWAYLKVRQVVHISTTPMEYVIPKKFSKIQKIVKTCKMY